jgi:hypothetical protein
MLEEPQKFNELFRDQDLSIVWVYWKEIGFCGAFSWKNNTVIPLDYDSYSENMTVYGYERIEDSVDILVGNDW